MSTNTVKTALNKCNEFSSDIIGKVCSLLDSCSIDYQKTNESEIVIDGKSKEEIRDDLLSISDIDSEQLKLLLQISEGNGKIFIRQKFN